MRCRFHWGIYRQYADGTRRLVRSYWSTPMRCDERPPHETGICLEDITPAC
jgi:hypothetical protein